MPGKDDESPRQRVDVCRRFYDTHVSWEEHGIDHITDTVFGLDMVIEVRQCLLSL